MPITKIDHIVVGATSLSEGVNYVKQKLGVDIPKGGEHAFMGTHNHVMQLGSDTFLEVIAINPDAPGPDYPRWFGLDDPLVRRSLQQPRLLAWVVNTDDLEGLIPNASLPIGEAQSFSRNDLTWLFSLPEDGRLLAGGAVPYVMQWKIDFHPSSRMSDLGCSLKSISIQHPNPEWLRQQLGSLGADGLVNIEPTANGGAVVLTATIDTPTGSVELSST